MSWLCALPHQGSHQQLEAFAQEACPVLRVLTHRAQQHTVDRCEQRPGASGKVRLRFDAKITKFSDPGDEGYLPEMRS